MSELYLSWGPSEDAGKVDDPVPLIGWLRRQSPNAYPSVRALLAEGKPADAAILEIEAAAALRACLLRWEEDIPAGLWLALSQLLDVLISRPPGRTTLDPSPADTSEYGPPQLVEWAAKANREGWPPGQLARNKMLLRLQPLLLDATPDDEEFAERLPELLVCLELLPDWPAE